MEIALIFVSTPTLIPVVHRIFKLASDIRKAVERSEGNESECTKLSERIDILIEFLKYGDFSNSPNEAIQTALQRFETFLHRCLEFILEFREATRLKRIISNKGYEKKFQDFNRELTQYSSDLNLGITLSRMQMDKKQHESQQVNIESDEEKKSPKMINDDHHIETPSRETVAVIKNFHLMETAANFQPTQESIFVSGLWKYRYQHHNQYYEPFTHYLNFDSGTGTVYGQGEDNVGGYELIGSFSETTGKLDMIKHYQICTENPTLNPGHNDVMQLCWNPLKNVFEGSSYPRSQIGFISGVLVEMWLA